MGLIGNILGIGRAAREVAEVFVPNKTKNQTYEHLEHTAALKQYGTEYQLQQHGWFNGVVNGLNRLPRPVLALGTVGLFAYAMAEPAGFSVRMAGLETVPRELWWLLGAIVSFYFGARELHHQRTRSSGRRQATPHGIANVSDNEDGNAAVADWLKVQR